MADVCSGDPGTGPCGLYRRRHPSALEAHDLERLLKTVKTGFPLVNDCEITVEGRIHSFSPEKIDACLAGGANCFFIGVRTFHTDLRRSMRRIADRDRIIEFLEKLKAGGRAVVVIDLIYGFPGQTMEMWRRDIGDFLSLDLAVIGIFAALTKTSSLMVALIGAA